MGAFSKDSSRGSAHVFILPQQMRYADGDVGGQLHNCSMTELSYMIRSDWAQHGTAMAEQSAVIRKWLGDPPYVFLALNLRKHDTENDADREFVDFVAPTRPRAGSLRSPNFVSSAVRVKANLTTPSSSFIPTRSRTAAAPRGHSGGARRTHLRHHLGAGG